MSTRTATIPALEKWRFEGSVPNWDDVLRRAHQQVETPSHLKRRRLLFATVTAALVVGAPAGALAVWSGLFSSEPGQVVAQARLAGPDGANGRLELRRMPRVGHGRQRLIGLRWTMRLNGFGPASSARIHVRGQAPSDIRLCRPCRADDDGQILLGRSAAIAVVNGGRVVVEARAMKLSGVLHPVKAKKKER